MSADAPRRPGRPIATETKERILSAALQLFAERGVAATSAARVAEQAGLSKQALQHHYATKDDLRAAVYESLAERWRAVHAMIGPAIDTLSSNTDITAIVENGADLFEAHPVVTRFIVRELLDDPDQTLRWLVAQGAPWFDTVRRAQERTEGKGRQPEGIDAEAHLVVVSALLLSLNALFVVGDEIDHLDVLRTRIQKAARRLVVKSSLGLDEEGQ